MIAVGGFALAGKSSTQKPDITVLVMHLQQFFTSISENRVNLVKLLLKKRGEEEVKDKVALVASKRGKRGKL